MKMQDMKKSETTEQINLFVWARDNVHALPCLSLMYHVPNEGKRANGAVLRAMGLKSGVPDVCLPVASHNYHGLYLEMKYGRNRATPEQEAFMAELRQQGYKTAICYGADEAKAEILEYLQEPGKMPLAKCLDATWTRGCCDGVPLGRMFCQESCRICEKHIPTKEERIINASMAAVDDCFKLPVIKAIINLSNGKPMQNLTLEDTLETINKNLALLAKGDWMTIEQSAAVLTVAMDAYSQAKEGESKA